MENTAQKAVAYFVERPEEEGLCVEQAVRGESVLVGPRGNGKTQIARQAVEKLKMQIDETETYETYEVDGSSVVQLSKLIERCKEAGSKPSIVILDGITCLTQQLLYRARKEKPADWIYITTTADRNTDGDAQVEVPGLSLDQFSELIRNLQPKCPMCEEDSKNLWEILEGNPLELYLAVEYMKCVKKPVSQLLESLQEGRSYALPKQCVIFKQDEYKSTLRVALAKDLAQIKENLSDCPEAFDALQAMAFFHNKDIPVEVFQAVFERNNSYDVVDNVLSQVQMYSLGNISCSDNEQEHQCRRVTLTKAFQRALISNMDNARSVLQKSLSLALKALLHLCHKDNRVVSDYKSQVSIELHIRSVLEQKVVEPSIGTSIHKVWLLSTLGHYLIQTDQVAKGETELERVFKVIEKDFLKNKKLLELTESEISALFELSEQKGAKAAIQEFVQSLRVSESDKSKWSSKAPELQKHCSNVTSLTPELHEKLVDSHCAYDVEKVVPYFLAELVATALYTYGRIFLYNCLDMERKRKALQVSKMICEEIERKHEGVKLMHSELVERNGLLCFKLKTPENESKTQAHMEQDAKEADFGYDDILNKSCDRYEFGLLKCIRNEQYHKLVCWRYRLKANKILYQVSIGDAAKQIYRTKIHDAIAAIDKVLCDHASPTGNLQRNTSIQTEIARALLMLGEDSALQKAYERFKSVCITESQCAKLNYPWMEALEGMLDLVRIRQEKNKEVAVRIAKHAKKEISEYIRRSGDLGDYEEKKLDAQKLLADVKDLLAKLGGTKKGRGANNASQDNSVCGSLPSSLDSFSSDIFVGLDSGQVEHVSN